MIRRPPFARGLRAWLTDHNGTAAAEMALVFPIFSLVSLNVMDFGVYAFSRMQTELAAQAAVGKARNLCDTDAKLPAVQNCGGTLSSSMTTAAQATSLGSNVTIGTPTEGYYCANASGNLILVAAYNGAPPATCSATVTGSTAKPGDYISVTASYTYVPFAPGLTIMSYLSTSIQQTAWMRLK